MKEICLSAEHFGEKNPIIFSNEHGREKGISKHKKIKKISEMRNNEFSPYTAGRKNRFFRGRSLIVSSFRTINGRPHKSEVVGVFGGGMYPFFSAKKHLGKTFVPAIFLSRKLSASALHSLRGHKFPAENDQ